MLLSDMDVEEVDFATLGETGDTDPVGVLLLSVGAPEKPEDVEVIDPIRLHALPALLRLR